MPHYLVAVQLPDDFDPSLQTEATIRDIHDTLPEHGPARTIPDGSRRGNRPRPQRSSRRHLTRHGYETAVQGKNGWVCMVGRGWMAMFDHPEFCNPKIRAADCLNPPAARSVLPYVYKRTELLLAGHSKPEVIAAIKAAIDKKELPALEQGTVDYMMSKSSYLTDNGDHNGPHLMFYETSKDDAAWGANLTNSPVLSVNYWYVSAQAYPQLKTFPPISVFLVGVEKWSDGAPAPPM
jgi:hypothetical protein